LLKEAEQSPMKDYQELLDTFYDPETREQTEAYFENCWLNKNEYLEKWLSIKETVFDRDAKRLPDMMFRDDLQFIPLRGGSIFTPEDFKLLQECMLHTGDRYFVIVQNENVMPTIYVPDEPPLVHPLLRFKYPANITWEELMNGGYISMELFQWFYKDYFVFGDSGKWGKYVANDYEYPLDIIGFRREYDSVFREKFKMSEEERQEIVKWLPPAYKESHNR
jgi:hypothetical protein